MLFFFLIWNKQVTLICLLMLKKESAKFLLICGWTLRSWLVLVALMLLQRLHLHLQLHLLHQRKAKGLSSRSNSVSFSNTRSSQIHLLLMEMDSEKVTRLCSSMVSEALLIIFDLLEDFLARILRSNKQVFRKWHYRIFGLCYLQLFYI